MQINSVKENHLNNSKLICGDDNSVNIYEKPFLINLPSMDKSYLHREEEDLIVERLKDTSLLCIYGMSGLGKTSIAIAIGHRLQEEFSNILYTDGFSLRTTKDTNNMYIEKLMYKENIETTIKRQKTLLIIDNVIEDLANIVDKFENMNLSESKVIITTQSANYVKDEYLYELKPLDEDTCKEILLKDVSEKYHDMYIKKILEVVSRNPLMIKIVNKLLLSNISLEDLCGEEEIMNAEDIDSEQLISDRIMKTFINSCSKEIKVISWLNSTYIDKGLLKYMLQDIGVKKIENRGVFDKYNSINENTIKIHDLILNAINNTVELSDIKCKSFEKKMIKYFEKLSKDSIEDNKYNNALYMHSDKINDINICNDNWGIEVYLLLKCSYDYEFDYEKWNKIDFEYLKYCEYSEEKYFQYVSVVEFLERKILRLKNSSTKEKYNEFIIECIRHIEKFLSNNTLDKKVNIVLNHHLGKLYFKNKDYNNAIEKFEYIINQKKDAYSAKLQLIRLYEQRNVSKSKEYICEILDAYKQKKKIDTTVVLATIQELRKKVFKEELEKYVLKDIDTFIELILSSSNFYFDLPFKVFVEVGKTFSYTKPKAYMQIAKQIPMKLSDGIKDDDMLFCMGEFYKNFIKSNIWDEETKEFEKISLIEEAEKCYKKIKKYDDYKLSSMVGFYILAEKPKEALVLSEKILKKEEPFIYYYISQAFELLFRKNYDLSLLNKSLDSIENSIKICAEKYKFESYISTFYRQKAIILNLKGDGEYKQYYELAIKNTNKEKFKKQMKEELESLILN